MTTISEREVTLRLVQSNIGFAQELYLDAVNERQRCSEEGNLTSVETVNQV